MLLKNWSIGLAVLLLAACSQPPKEAKEKVESTEEKVEVVEKQFPEAIRKIFDAHGGFKNWQSKMAVTYEIEDQEMGNEKHMVNLHSRQSLINNPDYQLGNDGEHVWIKDDSTKFKGNPRFMYNLMFYFYAMPFVLGDDGIIYTEVEDITLMDKTYKGIKISYEANVGESADDEYIVYYDPETNLMSWLAYTVTYFSKEKSATFHYAKYDEWKTVDGLLMPSKMVWYKYEDGKIGEQRGEAVFVNASFDNQPMGDEVFAMPAGAKGI